MRRTDLLLGGSFYSLASAAAICYFLAISRNSHTSPDPPTIYLKSLQSQILIQTFHFQGHVPAVPFTGYLPWER